MTKADREGRREEWRQRLGQWRASGLSMARFCREQSLSLWQFRYWVKRIAELDGAGPEGFACVTTAGSGLRLSLPGGLCLEVEPGFDEATLKRFLRALGAAC